MQYAILDKIIIIKKNCKWFVYSNHSHNKVWDENEGNYLKSNSDQGIKIEEK